MTPSPVSKDGPMHVQDDVSSEQRIGLEPRSALKASRPQRSSSLLSCGTAKGLGKNSQHRLSNRILNSTERLNALMLFDREISSSETKSPLQVNYHKTLKEECHHLGYFLTCSQPLASGREDTDLLQKNYYHRYRKRASIEPYPNLRDENVLLRRITDANLHHILKYPPDIYEYFATPSGAISKKDGCLYAGSVFRGVQMSNSKNYHVSIMFQHVDLSKDFCCGYLNIQNLTSEFPSLTTFFEGEIIGKRHSFSTSRWDASEIIDLQHWELFPEFEPFREKFLNGTGLSPFIDPSSSPFLFMRWKEYFLVPDHTVNNIHGASYDGFYYICIDLCNGEINGYYYYQAAKDWYEQLVLRHEPSYSFDTYEFQ